MNELVYGKGRPKMRLGLHVMMGKVKRHESKKGFLCFLVAVFDIEKAKERVMVVGEDGIEREEERTVELTHEYISAIHM